jgi:hypothetical protein
MGPGFHLFHHLDSTFPEANVSANLITDQPGLDKFLSTIITLYFLPYLLISLFIFYFFFATRERRIDTVLDDDIHKRHYRYRYQLPLLPTYLRLVTCTLPVEETEGASKGRMNYL